MKSDKQSLLQIQDISPLHVTFMLTALDFACLRVEKALEKKIEVSGRPTDIEKDDLDIHNAQRVTSYTGD